MIYVGLNQITRELLCTVLNSSPEQTIAVSMLPHYAPTPQNGQEHSNNSSVNSRRIVECLNILWG